MLQIRNSNAFLEIKRPKCSLNVGVKKNTVDSFKQFSIQECILWERCKITDLIATHKIKNKLAL